MSIVITGATGAFGDLVVTHLLTRGVPAEDIVAGGRDEQRLSRLADRGVRTARIDYDDPATLDAALHEGDRLLLVSATTPGFRIAQHRNVIEAATRAKVSLIAYTSLVNAEDNPVSLAEDHRVTEAMLTASGLPTVLLRNGWYLENYTDQLATYLETGTVLGATGDGRIAAATRSDFAEAAAAVLRGGNHTGRVYELGGEGFTLRELADAVSAVTGQDIAHRNVTLAELRQTLHQLALPGPLVAMLVSADAAIAAGTLHTSSTDLADLIGHRPTALKDVLTDAVAA